MAPFTCNPENHGHNRRSKHLKPPSGRAPSARHAVLVLGSVLCLTVCGGVLVTDGPAWASSGGNDPGVVSVTSTAWLACDPAGVQFESTVCNDGLSDLTQVELTEKLPSGMVLVDGSVSGAALCGADDASGEGDACPCEGGVTYLRLKYMGVACAEVEVTANNNTIFGPTNLCADSPPIELSGTRADGKFQKNNLILNAGSEGTIVHVSCSQPIGIGSVFGPFTVLAFSSRDGGVYDAPCDGTEQESGGHDDDPEHGDHEHSKVEICLSNPIAPGECVAITYVATFDSGPCSDVEVKGKTGDGARLGKTVKTKAGTDACFGQILNDALISACEGCPPDSGSGTCDLQALCGVQANTCPAQEQFDCLDAVDLSLWSMWDVVFNQCNDPVCQSVCPIGG